MIKVDIISGFLGAGKTTLIKLLAKAFIDNGERVVIIENEFGEIGVDGKILELDGLDVFEITNGCLCCSLKGDFVETLHRIAGEINPDRILIEPSGIFIPIEIFDIFKDQEIVSKMQINSLITIIDSLHYLKQRIKYSFFFENQIRYAESIIMSKTDNVSMESISIIRHEILKINPSIPLSTKPWSEMSNIDFLKLTSKKTDLPTKVETVNKKPSINNPTINRKNSDQKGHKSFQSFTLTPQTRFTHEKLKEILVMTRDPLYGSILRIKGFVENDAGFIEFNVVANTIDMVSIEDDSLTPSVYFIGENLDKKALEMLFDKK